VLLFFNGFVRHLASTDGLLDGTENDLSKHEEIVKEDRAGFSRPYLRKITLHPLTQNDDPLR